MSGSLRVPPTAHMADRSEPRTQAVFPSAGPPWEPARDSRLLNRPRNSSGDPPPLRIAFFTDSFVPTRDGVANVTATLASALQNEGHEVTVYTVGLPGLCPTDARADGVRVRRYRSVPAPGYPQYRIAVFPYETLLLRSLHRTHDVVHVHTPGFVGLAGWLAARRWGIPVVGTYHTHLKAMLRGSSRGKVSERFLEAWGRFAIDLCDACDLATVPTAAAAAALRRECTRPFAQEPIVVENGVDTRTFRPGLRRPDWKARLGAGTFPLVTFLGRLTRDKGVLRFLDMLDGWDPGVTFTGVVAGEGPQAAEVRGRLRRNHGFPYPVRYLGPVLESEKPALLAQTRVFVLPSLSDTSSVALLEAMASGAACVVTSRGGPGEIAGRSGACIAVDPEEPIALRNAVARVLRDRMLAETLGRRGRDWVCEHGSVERMARAFTACYRQLLEDPKSVDRTASARG